MLKRVVAASVGVLAVLGAVLVGFYAIQALQEFRNPAATFALAGLACFSLWSVAAVLLWFGLRLLRFAWSDEGKTLSGWVGAILLGIGSFLPGFVFSMPLTVIWSRYEWPGDGQAALGAMVVSFYIGIVVAIICSVVLIGKQCRSARAGEGACPHVSSGGLATRGLTSVVFRVHSYPRGDLGNLLHAKNC